MDSTFYLIDFDSTFIKTETLEELAAVALVGNPNKKKILFQIKAITNRGMDGAITYDQSLKRRLKLLKANKTDIKKTIRVLYRKISTSILRNKSFFQKNKKNIYIISSAFKELILPIVKNFGIDESHVFANTFTFDKKGGITGCDWQNPLAHKNGKTQVLKALNLKGEIVVIGDGYTDYELRESGLAARFIAFTENIVRPRVVAKADYAVSNFDEFLSFNKQSIKVLLLEKIDQVAIKRFRAKKYEIEYLDKGLSEDELSLKIKNISILGIRSRTKISKRVLKAARCLIAIGAFCIGTDQIDLAACQEKGIPVFNAPYSSTRSVAELVIGEIILLMRNVVLKNNKLHAGIWDKSAEDCQEIRGKILGIVGYGNIGGQLSVLAESLGMQVYFFDKVNKLVFGNAKKCRSLKELLRVADVVSIHVDGNKSNSNLIREREFEQMKDGVIFINASRGFIVDIAALVKYLKNGKVRGAAIDVFPNEPKSKGEKFVSPLQNLPNVILTPHIGGNTEEAQRNIGEFVSEKIINYVNRQ